MKFLREALIGIAIFAVVFGVVSYLRDSKPLPTGPLDFSVETLSGERIASTQLGRPMVLVFWATWCPPCKLELARLQALVDRGAIPRDSVLAFSVGEERDVVAKTSTERGYTFPVGLDADGSVANAYEVRGTPTIVLRAADGKIEWKTTGVSPSLEFKVTRFLAAR